MTGQDVEDEVPGEDVRFVLDLVDEVRPAGAGQHGLVQQRAVSALRTTVLADPHAVPPSVDVPEMCRRHLILQTSTETSAETSKKEKKRNSTTRFGVRR